ncbi:hypothetical protein HDV05_007381 [Chytridiales sp. JEL 0842]|nr:hypothetical protein HDV05_007381 [Chytridiales sp. JEL 0842]
MSTLSSTQITVAAGAATTAAIFYKYRRDTTLGLMLHLLLCSLPTIALRRLRWSLFGKPSYRLLKSSNGETVVNQEIPPAKLDLITAAFVYSIRWLVLADYPKLRDRTAFATIMQYLTAKYVLKLAIQHVKIPKKEGERGSVEGRWVAEREEDIPTDKLRADEAKDRVVVLYFHGGGYNTNNSKSSLDHHGDVVKRFNKRAASTGSKRRMAVFVLEYPLAPEHVYPAQILSAADAFVWMVNDLGCKIIFVGGDSAGGNLTISLLNHIRSTPRLSSLPVQPLASILYSPWVDLSGALMDVPTLNPDGSQQLIYDLIGKTDLTRWWGSSYGGSIPVEDPRLSVLYLDVKDIALARGGTLVLYGGAEMLIGSIRKFVEKIQGSDDKEAARKIEVVEWPDMVHNFNLFMLASPFGYGKQQAYKSMDRSVDFYFTVLNRELPE